MLSLGSVLLRLVIILVIMIGTIIIIRWTLKRWIWPAVKKTKSGVVEKIFYLLESVILSLIILQGTQAAVRLLSGSFSFYTELIEHSFFFLYWIICVLIILRMISIASDWYLARVPRSDLEEIDHRSIRYIQYISQLVFGFLAIIVLLDYFGTTTAAL